MNPDPTTGLTLEDVAQHFEIGDDPQNWAGYVRQAAERMALLETTLRALTLDDPIVCTGTYGDDSECYVCGGGYRSDHFDGCMWFAARAIFDLTTAGQKHRVPYVDDDEWTEEDSCRDH